MLYLILVDSELELIPEILHNEPDVRSLARRRTKKAGKMLLDASYMHTSIKKYYPDEVNRRGRPDLVHTFLMLTQDSILNKKGELRIFIHTRNNFVITLNPEVRPPKSYSRFVGLIEKLFETGMIESNGVELLNVSKSSLPDLLKTIHYDSIRVLSPSASVVPVSKVIPDTKNLVCLIGGFSFGDYISDVYSLADSFSIYEEELTVWTVASELITHYERLAGLLDH